MFLRERQDSSISFPENVHSTTAEYKDDGN